MDVNEIVLKVTGKPLPSKSIFTSDWLDWYRGKVRGFHNYRLYNGNNEVEIERKSLQMAKQVCETWANLLLNERCDIVLGNDGDKKLLDEILMDTNFWVKGNEGIEKSFALSYGALILNVSNLEKSEDGSIVRSTDSTRLDIDFINETKIYPITIRNKEITECAFVSKHSDGTNIVLHVKPGKTYQIYNYVLDKDNKVKSEYVFDTGYNKPFFWIMRPNISSNIMTDLNDEELGMSIFANSIDTLKAIDSKYDGFDWEFVLGRKKVFVSAEAWTRSMKDGKPQKTFDARDTLFYQLPTNDDGKQIITETQSELRWQAYVEAINQELNILSMKCGLGETYFKFNGSNVATATQVISENSTLYRNIKKHEIILEKVLIEMTKAVMFANNNYTMNTKFSDEAFKSVKIIFDDSIIEDKDAELKRDRQDVAEGLMAKYEYRMKWFGEDEETAKAMVKENFLYESIDRYMNALMNGGITPEMYVEKIYGDIPNKEEVIDYVEAFIAKPDMPDAFDSDEVGDNDERDRETTQD